VSLPDAVIWLRNQGKYNPHRDQPQVGYLPSCQRLFLLFLYLYHFLDHHPREVQFHLLWA